MPPEHYTTPYYLHVYGARWLRTPHCTYMRTPHCTTPHCTYMIAFCSAAQGAVALELVRSLPVVAVNVGTT